MSSKIKWIFFDCMETLVDLTELPSLRDYAAWAYYGSGVEELFGDFEAFFKLYDIARKDIAFKLAKDQEYEMLQRLELIVGLAVGDIYPETKGAARALYDNYRKNYKSRCYVKEDVSEVLARLKECFKLGVVSNFMVEGGIEELLEINGIKKHFEFVVTSIATGWKKPGFKIYEDALECAGAAAEEVLFFGDDYMNDLVSPAKYGMKSVLLDRFGKYDNIENRVNDFYELERLVHRL